jgi:hypothetical protein
MGFVDAKLRFNTIMPAAYGYLIFPLDYNTFMNSVSLFMNRKNHDTTVYCPPCRLASSLK